MANRPRDRLESYRPASFKKRKKQTRDRMKARLLQLKPALCCIPPDRLTYYRPSLVFSNIWEELFSLTVDRISGGPPEPLQRGDVDHR